MHLLTAPRLVTAGRLLTPGWVLVDRTVCEFGEGDPPLRVRRAARGITALTSGVIAPGLVDMHINGAFGADFATAGDDDWAAVARRLPSTGVTAFLPTFITAPLRELAAGLQAHRARRSAPQDAPGCAKALGIHLEGPFLAERRRGAHRADLLRDPTPDRVDLLLEYGGDDLACVTLAPERPGALNAVRRFVAAGVRVAIGHTDADEATVGSAVAVGASLVTHLYNAQSPLRHRDPGTVGRALTDDRLTCGLIVDLHHVEPTAVRVAFRCAGGRIALVTDAMAAMGMPTGTYQLGGESVEVRAGEPPRRADGTIAGSALRMDQAVGNAVQHCGVDLVTALDAATRIPAAALGHHDLGRIAVGNPADLVWLDDDLRAAATWVDGVRVWSRESDQRSMLVGVGG